MGPLISADELVGMQPAPVLLDTRPGAEVFASGHLAGALHADLDRLLSAALDPDFDPRDGGRHPLPPLDRWCTQLGHWGIGPQTPVVVYDGSAGGQGGARAWWMLKAVGHGTVSLLDGGMAAAVAAGWPLSLAEARAVPGPSYPAQTWGLPLVDLAKVDRLRQDPAWKLLDVRAPERWRGETEPFDPVPGRIPGSLNLPFQANLESDGRFKSAEALRRLYLDFLGDTPPERLAVHCGSGVTACHTLVALERAGLHGASLYMGSYSEWCRSDWEIGTGF